MKDIVLMEAASSTSAKKKYRCPYCNDRYERAKLHIHIQNKHADLIPEGYTALRVAFNTINHKTEGHCIMCNSVTDWNEKKGRYERLCNDPKCHEAYRKMAAERNKNKYGSERLQSDPRYAEEVQRKALAGRKGSGIYIFHDGGNVSYLGTYEKRFLEFMDKVMMCKSEDIVAPGPSIEYDWKGQKHLYLPDFYYIPYNLIVEIKDGGDNPNKNPAMVTYKTDIQAAKEKAVADTKKFNYIRLTDNDFSQLMCLMATLKYNMQNECYDPVMRINEMALLIESSFTKNIDTIIFDFGGVLMRTRPTVEAEAWAWAENHGLTHDEMMDLIMKYYEAVTHDENASEEECKARYKKIIDPRFIKYTDEIFYMMDNGKEVCDYTVPLLKSLKDKGYKLYYLSNIHKYAWKKRKEAGLYNQVNEFFEGGLFSFETGLQKPDPEIYKLMVKTYHLNPKNCLFIDDKEKNVKGAKSIGMNGLVFDRLNPKNSLRELSRLKNVKTFNEAFLNESKSEPMFKSDKDLHRFMKANISYKNFTKLMSAEEVLEKKYGSCHDQVMFELKHLRDMGYNPKAEFIIENNESGQGGMTHSFVYYNKDGKTYWFENAWEPMSGIHAYNNKKEILDAFKKFHEDGKFGNIKKYNSLEFSSFNSHKPGESLQDFVNICLKESVIYESTDESHMDKDHKQLESIKLSSLERKVRSRNDEGKSNVYSWYKDGDFVGTVLIDTIQASDGYKWFGTLRVSKKYRGHGLGDQIIDFAISKGAGALSVHKDNEIAIHTYKKHGFEISKTRTDKEYYYMYLKKNKQPLNESKDESHLDKSFKKKTGINYKIIDTNSDEGKKIYSKAWNDLKDHKNTVFALAVNGETVYGIIKVKIKSNNENVIGAFRVYDKYKGYGIGEKLFEYAVKKLDGNSLGVFSDNEVAINLYKKYGFVKTGEKSYADGDKVIIMKRKDTVKESDMAGTIGAALPLTPSPQPFEACKDNYYVIQHPQNNVFAYGITKDPLQYTMYSVDPEDKNYYKVFKTNKGDIDKTYLTFKIKDKQTAKELYDEFALIEASGKSFFDDKYDPSCYIYSRLTNGSKIISEDQLLFDDRFELVKDFGAQLREDCEKLYNYLMPKNIDILEEQVKELEEAIYG